MNAIAINTLEQMMSYLVNSISSDATWGKNEYDVWSPIITVATIDLLMSCGIEADEALYIDKKGITKTICLKDSIIALKPFVGENGEFGEDIWDACKFYVFVEKYSLHHYFPQFSKFKKELLAHIDTKSFLKESSEWSGPGTIAEIIDLFSALNETEKIDDYMRLALGYQKTDGSFRAFQDNGEIIHPVWHTSQMLSVMQRTGYVNQYPLEFNRALNWMNDQQNIDGSYKSFNRFTVYFTAYAISGYAAIGLKESPFCYKALQYIFDTISPTGRIGDIGATIMAAVALRDYLGDYAKASTICFYRNALAIERAKTSESRKDLQNASSDVTSLKKRIEDEESKYQKLMEKYDDFKKAHKNEIVLSKAFVWLIATAIAVAGLVFTALKLWSP